MKRNGDWMQTFTGRMFWPLDPRPDEVSIVDIAHALSLQCRFGGHCKSFYSVAEHSVRVSLIVPSDLKLWGLLHDAAEAYLVDLPRPIKHSSTMGSEYRAIERRVMHAICEHFGLPIAEPPAVKHADEVMLATEARDLLGKPPAPWCELPSPIQEKILPHDPAVAKLWFIHVFEELTARA